MITSNLAKAFGGKKQQVALNSMTVCLQKLLHLILTTFDQRPPQIRIEASLLASWGQCLHDEVELPAREVRQYGCSGDLQNIRTWETTSNMEGEVRQELGLGGPQSFTATPMDDNAPSETPPVIPDTPVVTFDSHMPPVTTPSISQPSCQAVNSSDSPLVQHPRVPDFKTSLAAWYFTIIHRPKPLEI